MHFVLAFIQETRLVEIQKQPKKIAPKNWAYLMKYHTFMDAKKKFQNFSVLAFWKNGLQSTQLVYVIEPLGINLFQKYLELCYNTNSNHAKLCKKY